MYLTHKLNEPTKSLTYVIKTRILETIPKFSGNWFVDVWYETNEQLVVRRIVYGPCQSLIMAVLTEDEIRRAHVASIASLLEHIHTLNFG